MLAEVTCSKLLAATVLLCYTTMSYMNVTTHFLWERKKGRKHGHTHIHII